MKKTTFTYGGISGLIVATFMIISTLMFCANPDFSGNSEIYGFAGLALAFTMVFLGIKHFRNKVNGGTITFGKAFLVGLYIALISSTIYVLVWLVEYYCFFPDFMEIYSTHAIKKAEIAGKTFEELAAITKDMETMKSLYKNPVWVILLTYMEAFPIGLLFALISAAILRRKAK